MMKKTYLILFAIISSFCLNAQESENAGNDLKKFGIGLYARQFKFNDAQSYEYIVKSPGLLLSYNIQNFLRLETNFGFQTFTREDYKNNVYHIGLNCLGMFQKEKVNFLYGIMVGYDNDKIERTTESYNVVMKYDIENKRISYGPKIGAEYLFSKHFSIGGDVGLVYYKENYEQIGGNIYYEDNKVYKTTSWLLDSGLFMKFYF